MFHKEGNRRRAWRERAFSLFLTAALLLGSLPGLALPAAAAHWADSYLDQLVDWGVMRADQTANPDTPLTRAEFMAIINRAYGYKEVGPIPFEDVSKSDWFYDDVAIAYTAGYMKGTSKTAASPNARLTREQAICILGRNMMLKETPGEDLAFTDSRSISSWARGMVKTAVDNYIVRGYPDDSFRPKENITKGQMAVLVTQCVGTPINAGGTYEMGGVFGNVTITAPNVTLRNTTVSGDLYVSGGVGLGGVKLENVDVLGRIIVSGTGESERGAASVMMRNVTAEEMLVDNMRNKTVTIRADGITDIAKTTVRTNAYIEDNNTDANGLKAIELDGESGTRLTLAGRVKDVVNKTPNSQIQMAKGTLASLTVDEAAVNSNVQLDRNTSVKEMNLDVAANVTGDGDIDQLNINAPGSVVSMLPDKTYIRPGLTSNVAGVVMDHVAAEEGSLDPRLLSGYPAARDITPTGLRADFAGNKKGTVYWAVSSVSDGSIGEDDLISPPSYGSRAVRNGSVAAPTGGSEVSAQITGLTVGGSYYLSAILVDDQGHRSPVKVVSFNTPDNTVPAFGQGYPYMSFIGKANEYESQVTAQVAVMATKTCRMYYAVLPAGTPAPTVDELKTAAVPSNLGYGVMNLEKNEVWDGDRAIIVSRRLAEQKNYVLYLWLTDGVNSSAVTSLAFPTPDVTPPIFVTHPQEDGDVRPTSVPLTATINENGTIFWVAVKSGAVYPKPNPNNDKENEADKKTARLDSDYAKLQVTNGMNAVSKGQVNATANTPAKLNITGLQAETSYDLYYLARDAAGNYTVQVYKLQGGLRTLDTGAPTVRQIFTSVDPQDASRPRRDTSIVLEFSENVRLGSYYSTDLLTMYEDTQTGTTSEKEAALREFVQALRENIDLEFRRNGVWRSAVKDNTGVGEKDWAVDFSKATVVNSDGKIQLTFPNNGLQLKSGGSYRFSVSNQKMNPITDLSGHQMENPPVILDEFTIVFAQVNLFSKDFTLSDTEWPTAIKEENEANKGKVNIGEYKVDFRFRMSAEDTEMVADGIAYDLLLWSNIEMQYDLYYRVVSEKDDVRTAITAQAGYGMPNMPENPDINGWVKLGNSGSHYISTQNPERAGKSLHCTFNGISSTGGDMLPQLNQLRSRTEDGEEIFYDFAISVRRLTANSPDPDAWSDEVNMYVDVAAGYPSNLISLGNTPSVTLSAWRQFCTRGLNGNGGESVGAVASVSEQGSDSHELWMNWPFTDKLQPEFQPEAPDFKTTENSATMTLGLTQPGHIYYIIGCASAVDHTKLEPSNVNEWVPSVITEINGAKIKPEQVPVNGKAREDDNPEMPVLSKPLSSTVLAGGSTGDVVIKAGHVYNDGRAYNSEAVPGLQPNTTYYAYFVITGANSSVPSEVQIYKFKTAEPQRPIIKVGYTTTGGNNYVTLSPNINSMMAYKVYIADETKLPISDWKSKKFVDYVRSDLKSKLPDAYRGNYSVYDALKDTYRWATASAGITDISQYYFPSEGMEGPAEYKKEYSVFDIYASNEIKESVQRQIESTSDQPADGREKEFAQTGGGTHRGTKNLLSDTPYFVIAMARRNPDDPNLTGIARYSFQGGEITIGNQDPPRLLPNECSGTFIVDVDGETITSGSISLVFDKAVYYDDGTSRVLLREVTPSVYGAFTRTDGIKGNDDGGIKVTVSSNNHTTIDFVLDKGTYSGLLVTSASGVWTNAQGGGAGSLRIVAGTWNKTTGDYTITASFNGVTVPFTIKGPVVLPETTPASMRSASANFAVSPYSGSVDSGTVTLSFDNPLYLGEDQPVNSAKQLLSAASEVKGIDAGGSTVSTSDSGTTVTLKLQKDAKDVALKIDGGTLTSSTGEAAEEPLTVKLDKRVEPSQSGIQANRYYMDISWGDETWTSVEKK